MYQMDDGQLRAAQRNAIRRYDMRPLCCMSFVVNANYLQALSWSLSLNPLSTSLYQTHLHHLRLRG